MTEAEWLNCTAPETMLDFLRDKASQRKLRLFTCACCRRMWGLLQEERSRRAIEVGENFADGRASVCDLQDTEGAAAAAAQTVSPTPEELEAGPDRRIAAEAVAWAVRLPSREGGYAPVARHVADGAAIATAFRITRDGEDCYGSNEHLYQVALLRDVFGNPFHPVSVRPSWLTPTVVSLAQAAYDERLLPSGELDPHRLAVLADALEEAGCSADAVDHLRSPGPHVRGCFVVDALLGKQ